VYDRTGRLNPRLSSEAAGQGLPVFDGASRWLESLVADPARVEERRRALVAAYGSPIGRTRRLDRYVSDTGSIVEEVLADPESALVMEIVDSEHGRLRRRTTFDYASLPDGRWFRRTIRSEEPHGDRPGERTVVSVVFSNLTVDPAR
jgi:hypothetical protein